MSLSALDGARDPSPQINSVLAENSWPPGGGWLRREKKIGVHPATRSEREVCAGIGATGRKRVCPPVLVCGGLTRESVSHNENIVEAL